MYSKTLVLKEMTKVDMYNLFLMIKDVKSDYEKEAIKEGIS